jgi:hypothetical protein
MTATTLSKPWQKFFLKFKDIEVLRTSQWKEVHMLAYIVKRFEEAYNRNFCYSFQGPPSKCTEIVLVKRIYWMLNTSNPRTIKEYIDWVYDFKLIPKNIKIRKLSFFLQNGLANEFFAYRAEMQKISKATELPPDYQLIVSNLGLPVRTYGDLAFAKQALSYSGPSALGQYKQLFDQLHAIGFEDDVLKTIV